VDFRVKHIIEESIFGWGIKFSFPIVLRIFISNPDWAKTDIAFLSCFSATDQIINEGKYVTFDIGGEATTTQMSEKITELAKANLRK